MNQMKENKDERTEVENKLPNEYELLSIPKWL